MVITSVNNAKVMHWSKLRKSKYRQLAGLFLVEEKHLIQEAISANRLQTLIVREGVENEFLVDEVYVVSDNVMKKLSENTSLNDYIGVCTITTDKTVSGSSFIILENVQDPGNVGTIIRTAYSFGYDGVLLTDDCASLYNGKTIQATQGALFHIPVYTMSLDEIIQEMKNNDVYVYATDLHTDTYLKEVKVVDKYALMFGNEGNGLSEKAISLADERVKIEMENFESLNVAIACGICAYQFKTSD